jgi:hypothetical protein
LDLTNTKDEPTVYCWTIIVRRTLLSGHHFLVAVVRKAHAFNSMRQQVLIWGRGASIINP